MFCIEGRTTTSEAEAIEAIAQHIENIYKEPTNPINIPPWNPNHGVAIDIIEKAVGLAVFSAKKGKASDTSGLSNACIKSLGERTINRIAKIIRENGEAKKDSRENGKKNPKDSFSTKKKR